MKEDKTTLLTWLDKQRVKNELFGEYVEAVEIYPKEADRKCSEGIYHLWLLSDNTVIPFGLSNKKMKVVIRHYKRNPIGFVAELAKIMGIK